MASSASSAASAGAAAAIAAAADGGDIEAWDDDLVSWDPLAFTAEAVPYDRHLAEATARTGARDSILTGRATIDGRGVVLVVGEFGFLGGSIGVASGERIARAFDRARELRLPVLAITASGGTRMQEGTPAFLQMVKAAAAVERFRAAGLAYVAYLQDPTMGGVLASWGSLATVTWAAPGARLGFSGPRVAELITGAPFPAEVQRAEHLLGRGLLDDVFPLEALPERFGRVLAATGGARSPSGPPQGARSPSGPPHGARSPSGPPRSASPAGPATAGGDAWASVQRSRDPGRPGARELLDTSAADVTVLRGDRSGGGDDQSCLCALAVVDGVAAVVIAQVRAADGRSRAGPAGLRKARRAMALAAELGLPLITIIDSPAAELSAGAEEGGLSGEIARCIATLLTLASPTVCVLLGEGGGGGALALFPADRVVCAEHAWLSPIAPEGASAILWRSTDHAPDLARAHGLASWQLRAAGLVDRLVAEPAAGGSGSGPGPDAGALVERMARALAEELRAVVAVDDGVRLAARHERYRRAWSPPR